MSSNLESSTFGSFNFDIPVERRGTDSGKWGWFGEDVLPMWVADMDFASPQPIIDALQRRVQHGVFGYGMDSNALKQTIVERMARLYAWTIQPDDIVMLSGLVSGLNIVSRAVGEPGDGVLINTPVYGPFSDRAVQPAAHAAIGARCWKSAKQGRPPALHAEHAGVGRSNPAHDPAVPALQPAQPGRARLHPANSPRSPPFAKITTW